MNIWWRPTPRPLWRRLAAAALVLLGVVVVLHRSIPFAPRHESATVASSSYDVRDGAALRVLVIADTHLDPFVEPRLARRLAESPVAAWEGVMRAAPAGNFPSVGHDTNPALLLSAIDAMQAAVPHPDVVLVAGDLLAHTFRERYRRVFGDDDVRYRRFVYATSDLLATMLARRYPHARIIPTIGNNDGLCGDYHSTPDDAYLSEQARRWAPLVADSHFERSYAQGGNAVIALSSRLRLIDFNSVPLAARYENPCGLSWQRPTDRQILWLQAALQQQPRMPTLLLTHIPPGIDAFTTFLHLGLPVPYYQSEAQRRVLHLLTAVESPVTAMITGHLHQMGYRTAAGAHPVPILSLPSVSPIFGNAPAFSELEVNAAGDIRDVRVWQLDPAALGGRAQNLWSFAYDVDQRYDMQGITAASLRVMHDRERTSRAFSLKLSFDRVGGGVARFLNPFDRHANWCAETALQPDAYLRCERAP